MKAYSPVISCKILRGWLEHYIGLSVDAAGSRQHTTKVIIIYRDIIMMKSCHVHINMCIYI